MPDWTRFGYDAARSGRSPRGLTRAQVGRLRERRVRIDGTVDSSPVYIANASVRGKRRELLVVTTTYGRTLGLDPSTGAALWRFTPASYSNLAGSPQITNATPVVDPSRRYMYTVSPDGLIHKLRVSDGREAPGGWPVSVTRDPAHEKIAPALNIDGNLVLVTTGGYLGDIPPYQGKVVAIDRSSGRLVSVFNSLCSDRRQLITPSSCDSDGSAIWGRAGAVVDPRTHRVYATTGNAAFNGSTDWGDSVLELKQGSLDLLRHYTPANQTQLAQTDGDLGSTSPALLPDPDSRRPRITHLLQGGKDQKLRLLSLSSSLRPPNARLGGEVQTLPVPGGQSMFTAPAVLHRKGLTEVFVATGGGTGAYRFSGSRLTLAWRNGNGGTSPLVAGPLLWIYDPEGALDVYAPSSGRLVRRLPAPPGHWNSPIVAGGRVYLPSGDANDHSTSGVLSIYSVQR